MRPNSPFFSFGEVLDVCFLIVATVKTHTFAGVSEVSFRVGPRLLCVEEISIMNKDNCLNFKRLYVTALREEKITWAVWGILVCEVAQPVGS